MGNCNSNTPFNVRIAIDDADVVHPEYEIRGVAPIKVVKHMEGTKTVFIVSYTPTIGPTCKLTVSPSILELGIEKKLVFTKEVHQGSSEIATEIVTPVDFDSDLELTVLPTQIGSQFQHTLTVTDEEGLSCASTVGVVVKYRFFEGTIARNETTIPVNDIVTGFVSNLGLTIGEAFPRQSYTMNQVQGHFVWVYPADFVSIPTPTGDGNFPFQIEELPGTWTINGITYKAAKTSTYFAQNGVSSLGF